MIQLKNNINFFTNNDVNLIDKKLIDNIDNSFLQLNNIRSKLSKATINEIFFQINDNLKKIFIELNTQIFEKDYEIFLNELSKLISNYLDELKNHYLEFQPKELCNNNLFKKKFFLEKLDQNLVNEIIKILNFEISFLKEQNKNGKKKREDLSINKSKNIKKVKKLLNKNFKNNGILETVSNYMGKEYIITGCALELSVCDSTWWRNLNQENHPKTKYAHVDESFLYPKSICYLSDVNYDNGPTSYYPNGLKFLNLNYVQNIIGRIVHNIGTSSSSTLYHKYNNKNGNRSLNCSYFKSHFSLLPNNIKFDSHFGWDVFQNSKLEKMMVDDEKFLIGKKGTCIVFDGSNLVHRGGLILKNERLVLQIVFGPKLNLFEKSIKKLKSKLKKLS